MNLFGLGRRRQETAAETPAPACCHPVRQQAPLREDPSDPGKVTGIKCYQCGERIPGA